MLWNVRIPLHTKLALLSVFSLAVIVMVIALVRLLIIPAGTIATDLHGRPPGAQSGWQPVCVDKSVASSRTF